MSAQSSHHKIFSGVIGAVPRNRSPKLFAAFWASARQGLNHRRPLQEQFRITSELLQEQLRKYFRSIATETRTFADFHYKLPHSHPNVKESLKPTLRDNLLEKSFRTPIPLFRGPSHVSKARKGYEVARDTADAFSKPVWNHFPCFSKIQLLS